MEKKTIIALSLISAVLSLVYILLSYFGFLRYSGMYIFSTQGYVDNYKNLDKIDEKNKVVISMTSTPEQMKNLSPVINSLLDQTVGVDLITLVVPKGPEYKLPVKLKDTLTVFRYGEKRDQLAPLFSTIMREGESTTKIIVLGDNKIYGKDFIEQLIDESNKNPDKIIYNNTDSDLIDLKQGVIFKASFFSKDFFDVKKGTPSNVWVNDYFKKRGKVNVKYSENYKAL